MLKIDSLSFEFDKRPLLQNLSLTLKKGENLTILGENGAGKSTLAKLICGLLPSKKTIMIEGKYIEDIPPQRRAAYINYMPSKFSLYDSFITLKEYLELSSYKQTPKEQKSKEILAQLNLSSYENSYASTLSSGQQQLLLLASALIQSAEITIFDEPTSNLDPQKRKLVFDILSTSNYLKQKIIITHDLQLALKLDYPILYLKEGRATYFENGFFEASNLKKHFSGTIMIVDNNIVECL